MTYTMNSILLYREERCAELNKVAVNVTASFTSYNGHTKELQFHRLQLQKEL